MNKVVIVGLVILFVLCIYVSLNSEQKQKSETENFDNNKKELFDRVANFIKPNTTYGEYLDFIATIKNNTSYLALEQEVFYDLKRLSKQGRLNPSEVAALLTDI